MVTYLHISMYVIVCMHVYMYVSILVLVFTSTCTCVLLSIFTYVCVSIFILCQLYILHVGHERSNVEGFLWWRIYTRLLVNVDVHQCNSVACVMRITSWERVHRLLCFV